MSNSALKISRTRLLALLLVAVLGVGSIGVTSVATASSDATVAKKKKKSAKKKCKKGYKKVKGKCKKAKKPANGSKPAPSGGSKTSPGNGTPPAATVGITSLVVNGGFLGGLTGNYDIEVTATTNGQVTTTPITLKFADSSSSKDIAINFSSSGAGSWNAHYMSVDTFPSFAGTVTVTAKAGAVLSAPTAITFIPGL
jgi:hypothetical protein